MSNENRSDVELFDSNIEDVAPSVTLKIQGLSLQQISSLTNFFAVEFKSDPKISQWTIKALDRAFGTHKIQMVQLFAVALTIHSHFPDIRMALMNSADLEPSAPLKVSEATQIFLEQAGFNLNVEKTERTLSQSEMTALKEQFYRLQSQSPEKKGA